jgi:hypothetical protein
MRGDAKGSAGRKKPKAPKKTNSVPTGVVYRNRHLVLIENRCDVKRQCGTSTISRNESVDILEIALRTLMEEASQ